MLRPTLYALFLALLLCSTTRAQKLNEIYVSHSGFDDQEFIEIVGTPGTPLGGYVVVVVEGDSSSSGFGNVDRAVDLSSTGIPTSGYFVLGDTQVPNVNLVVGSSNIYENGTETFYLIQSANPGAITSLVGTNVVVTGTTTTTLGTLGTIVDLVGLTDGDLGDQNFDNAPVLGPDGFFLPAGIFRDLDYPGSWCNMWLDFNDQANFNLPRTPGAPNGPCCRPDLGFGGSGPLALSVCGLAAPGTATFQVAGAPALTSVIIALDIAVNASGLPTPDGGQYLFPAFPPLLILQLPADASGVVSVPIPLGPLGLFGQAAVVNPAVTGGIDVSNVVNF